MSMIAGVGNVATECRHAFSNLSHTIGYTVVGRPISLLVILELGEITLLLVSNNKTLETSHGALLLRLLVHSC